MQALYVFRWKRRQWRLVPLLAVKCAAISLTVVLLTLTILDRVVLPKLEQQGLTAGEDWSRHNAVVIHEHQLSDRTIAFPEPRPPLVPAGVREWAGQRVEQVKPHGAKRVLVMGDSFVWGSAYLTLNHMWWRQLGQILAPDGVEVIAIGRPGASTRDQLQWAKYFVPKYQPDLIIWGYVTNDADEGLVRQIQMSQQSIPKLDRVRSAARKIWPRLMSKFDALRSSKLAAMYTGPKYGYEYSEWELKLVEPENLAAYAKTVGQVKELHNQLQIPGFMMTLPNFPSTARFEPRYLPVMNVWRDAGLAAYDTVPEFVRKYGETPLTGSESIQWGINPGDGHPGPRSCRFLAEQAAGIIRRDFPQIIAAASARASSCVINDWLPHYEPDLAPSQGLNGDQWKMTYPANEAEWPTMPLGVPTQLLAFRDPTPLTSIALGGTSLTSAEMWLTFLDEAEHYDDGIVHSIGEKNGSKIEWEIPPELASRPVSVIRFRATFADSSREVLWSFSPKTVVNE